jgi:hypothetical protein
MISARELAEREQKRLDVKKATYRAILEQFSRKISNAATLGKHELTLTTPQFVIGYPVYDVVRATDYIQRQLDRLGYTTRRALPQVVHVTWKKPTPSNRPIVIDHSAEDDLPSLTNLAKTAQTIRSRRSTKK